ncbi:MAG: hypothetical protein OXH16_16335 [Gemmatimonadetes bacterium]|nr:hypothetical protein [Gemmatimonadota bacterium]
MPWVKAFNLRYSRERDADSGRQGLRIVVQFTNTYKENSHPHRMAVLCWVLSSRVKILEQRMAYLL